MIYLHRDLIKMFLFHIEQYQIKCQCVTNYTWSITRKKRQMALYYSNKIIFPTFPWRDSLSHEFFPMKFPHGWYCRSTIVGSEKILFEMNGLRACIKRLINKRKRVIKREIPKNGGEKTSSNGILLHKSKSSL